MGQSKFSFICLSFSWNICGMSFFFYRKTTRALPSSVFLLKQNMYKVTGRKKGAYKELQSLYPIKTICFKGSFILHICRRKFVGCHLIRKSIYMTSPKKNILHYEGKQTNFKYLHLIKIEITIKVTIETSCKYYFIYYIAL